MKKIENQNSEKHYIKSPSILLIHFTSLFFLYLIPKDYSVYLVKVLPLSFSLFAWASELHEMMKIGRKQSVIGNSLPRLWRPFSIVASFTSLNFFVLSPIDYEADFVSHVCAENHFISFTFEKSYKEQSKIFFKWHISVPWCIFLLSFSVHKRKHNHMMKL